MFTLPLSLSALRWYRIWKILPKFHGKQTTPQQRCTTWSGLASRSPHVSWFVNRVLLKLRGNGNWHQSLTSTDWLLCMQLLQSMFLIQELCAYSIPYDELLIRLTTMPLNLSVTETRARSCRRVCDRSFPELHGESALCSKESFMLLGSFPEHKHQMQQTTNTAAISRWQPLSLKISYYLLWPSSQKWPCHG